MTCQIHYQREPLFEVEDSSHCFSQLKLLNNYVTSWGLEPSELRMTTLDHHWLPTQMSLQKSRGTPYLQQAWLGQQHMATLIPSSAAIFARDHSSSLLSPSSSSSAFLAGFFFFFLFLLLLLVPLPIGCSRILRISSSVILFSVLYFAKSSEGEAVNRVIPFLVIARKQELALLHIML